MAAPAYVALLNAADVSGYFTQDSWQVTQAFGRAGDRLTAYLHDDFSSGQHYVGPGDVWSVQSPPFHPNFTLPPLQAIKLTDSGTGALLFAGVTQTPKLVLPAPKTSDWQLDCLDYTLYTDNVIVNGDFRGQTADSIVRALVAQANIGLGTVNVRPAPTITRIQINYIPLSAALTKLARMSSQVTDYGWFIDYNYDLHFFSFKQAAAPTVTMTDNVTGNPTATRAYYANDSTFGYEWDGGSLRNSCIVRGANYQGARTDTFRADGVTQAWPLTYNIDSTVAPTLTINGTAVKTTTVSLLNVGTAVTTAYQINQNAAGQWFLVSRVGAPGNGRLLVLSYRYIAPIVTRVDNRTSQTVYGGLNHGVFQMAVTDGSLTSLSSAMARGNAELQAFQWVQERVTFTTLENWPGHVNAGDVITFENARIPNSLNSYNLGISGKFLIVSNTYVGVQGNYRKYTITATRIT